jgi:lysine decarboxylase/arginine decarboxylase
LTPRQAWQARNVAVPLAGAVDHVSAEMVVPYPPGIPVLTPGELVTNERMAYLTTQ